MSEWKSKLDWISLFDDFAITSESLFGLWIKHIRISDQAELEKVEKEIEEIRKSDGIDIHVPDLYYQMGVISNIKHATFIVGLWAKIEFRLRQLIELCEAELKTGKSLNSKFDIIKSYFSNEMRINLESLIYYNYINAIRLLNNFFKHFDGRYNPDINKKWNMIDEFLCNQWDIVAGEEINYTNVSLEKLVSYSATFINSLTTEIKKNLNSNSDLGC